MEDKTIEVLVTKINIMEFTPVVRIESELPLVLNKKDESYNEERVITKDFFHLVDRKDVYLQGLLAIDQIDLGEKLEWLLWVKVCAKSFIKMIDNLRGEKSMIDGELISPVLFYEDTNGLEVKLEFQLKDKPKFPKVIVLDNHDSLSSDFSNGLKKEIYLQWQSKLLGRSDLVQD